MSMKGVEMQIAIPRTNEATSVQNHLNHKPTYDQAVLANQTTKLAERRKKVSAEVDASAFLNVKEEGNGGSAARRNAAKPRAAGKEEDARLPGTDSGHPYKGKHIDISL
ncbi:hypothetical protein FE782_22725 [Paenibacillus antri]|uniref:Uncharacterized protein n=1 Tax=Paenibacillus antri TaxID=2582848 RepID=A0A5R9GAR6_9BACL|nr:hypothetical protein [Paenibacillus antri]TLS49823.1 hypothetical protein FE782_22725 [Paenibacillus antri]